MSQILGIDVDGAEEEGSNYIGISIMNGSTRNDDYTIGGSSAIQEALHALIKEYGDIFRHSVKGWLMDVPPLKFDVDRTLWRKAHIGTATLEKQSTLSTIDELLDGHTVIQSNCLISSKPSRVLSHHRLPRFKQGITNEGW